MGIDGIGKGGAPPIIPETKSEKSTSLGPTGASQAKETFSVEAPADPKHAAEAAATEAASSSSPLARLCVGEIDVNGYVDLKVDEATHALQGLSPTELADIKKALRDQLSTDPGLADLVRQATGKVPNVPED